MAPRVGTKLKSSGSKPVHVFSVRMQPSEFLKLDHIARSFNVSLNEAMHLAVNSFFETLKNKK